MDYLEVPFTVTIKRLWWQEQGLQQTATGYGDKLCTQYMLYIQGSKRAHRVYAVCWSNVASYYIMCKKQKQWLRDSDLEAARNRIATER